MRLTITKTAEKVLVAIENHPAYGYALSKELHTNLQVVYRILNYLEKRGYIKHTVEEGKGADRKIYQITAKGRKLLELL